MDIDAQLWNSLRSDIEGLIALQEIPADVTDNQWDDIVKQRIILANRIRDRLSTLDK